MNPSNSNNRNQPPDGQTGVTNRPWIAEALIPRVTQVLNSALAEAISTGARTGDQIRRIVAGHSLRWALPPELVPDIQIFVLKYLDRVAQQKSKIEEFLNCSRPGKCPSICYEVFQYGNTYYCYDTLPEEVLKLKKSALFWIYRSANELLSRGQPRERNEWIPPKAEEMLRFFCEARNAGTTIPFLKLYTGVWKPASSPSKYKMCNSINVRKNAINTFAGEQFIKTVSDKSKQDDKRVLRIRGCNEFKVGKEVSAKLIIIKKIAPL